MMNEKTIAGTDENSGLAVRRLLGKDLAFCRKLVAQAGWNQTDADWLRMIGLEPEGCFLGEWEGEPVATTTTSCFGHCAWIAMVLVDEAYRNRGIARQMLRHALDYLDHKKMETIRLDATSLGKGLYRQLGFEEEYEVIRFVRGANGDVAGKPLFIEDHFIEKIIALDKSVTATDRKYFFQDLLGQNAAPGIVVSEQNGEVTAYSASRVGRVAVQMGPAAAISEESGKKALSGLLTVFTGESVLIDIPADNEAAKQWAIKHGFAAERSFTRMYRGRKIADTPQMIWACAGPEKG